MKRQYMHPTMKVVEIKRHQQLLAGSTIPMRGSGSADEAEAPEYGGDITW